ncbi:hypothetical protein B0H19DRAFT_1380303 [Mycena capillaripes]|nr:hypothetical protein B0H19DRAFT_1380303 [Mycena capillaripes]
MSLSMSSHLLNLSPELHLFLFTHLSQSKKRRLRIVSRLFNNFLFLDVPFKDLRAAQKDKTVFLVEDACKGKLGFEPFIIMHVRRIRNNSGQSEGSPTRPSFEQILLDIYYPKYMWNNDEHDEDYKEEDSYWEIQIEMKELILDSKNIGFPSLPQICRLRLAAREAH